MKLVKDTDDKGLDTKQVSDKEAEDAFRTILSWMGEDPSREGLLETPKRVVKAFKEYFKGYKEDPNKILDKLLVMLRVMTTWLFKKIFQFKVIANIIWLQSLEKHT